ncbi:hypothetical protein HYX00_03240 [Candidatus Woesearchaeota archaeon]|nr:hypothetical protein [Candidatus Woesearchaeota archaeon]
MGLVDIIRKATLGYALGLGIVAAAQVPPNTSYAEETFAQSHAQYFSQTYNFNGMIKVKGKPEIRSYGFLEIKLNGDNYFAQMQVVQQNENGEEEIFYYHSVEGVVKFGRLLPQTALIYRKMNINIPIPIIPNHDRHDELIQEFKYPDESSGSVKTKSQGYDWKKNKPIESSSDPNPVGTVLDLVTAITQALIDLKMGERPSTIYFMYHLESKIKALMLYRGNVAEFKASGRLGPLTSVSGEILFDHRLDPVYLSAKSIFNIFRIGIKFKE